MRGETDTEAGTDAQGIFIVLEGSDGSGKKTQLTILADKLRERGYELEVFDFPRYEQPSSHFVQQYLNGKYGPAGEVNPYTASLFFALDRFEVAPLIQKALSNGKIVLCNRYVGSNMAHQGAKFSDPVDQRSFFVWEDGLEYQLLGVPRPTINIFLRVPAETSFRLIADKAKRNYTESIRDEHEADIQHLRNAVRAYDSLHHLFPKDFKAVECTANGTLLGIDEISDMIWEIVADLLPEPPTREAGSPASRTTQPQAIKEIIKALPPVTGPATPKSSSEMRLPVKRVSLLAAAVIVAHDGVSAQPREYWHDSSDYFIPEGLTAKTRRLYREFMESAASRHARYKRQLKEHLIKHGANEQAAEKKAVQAAMPLLPLAALAPMDIIAPPHSLAALIRSLRADPLPELRKLADVILSEAHRMYPQFPADFSKEKQVEETSGFQWLPASEGQGHTFEPINITKALPRNEFELLGPEADTESWTFGQKQEALLSLLHKDSESVLSRVYYEVDAVTERPKMSELLKKYHVANVQMHPHAPDYGYWTPATAEEAGVENDHYEQCDGSAHLYNVLQEQREDLEAGYATLFGHRIRVRFSVSAESLWQPAAGTSNKETGLIFQMKDKVPEIHPLIGDFLLPRVRSSTALSKMPSKPKKRTKRGNKSPKKAGR